MGAFEDRPPGAQSDPVVCAEWGRMAVQRCAGREDGKLGLMDALEELCRTQVLEDSCTCPLPAEQRTQPREAYKIVYPLYIFVLPCSSLLTVWNSFSQVIEEYAISAGGGEWRHGGGKPGNARANLEDELRPETVRAFRALFDVDLSGSEAVTGVNMSARGDMLTTAFTMWGKRLLVVRQTWNSFCMVSKYRREGVVVCHLPAGMLLVCTFCRPMIPQTVVPAVEKVCQLLWC